MAFELANGFIDLTVKNKGFNIAMRGAGKSMLALNRTMVSVTKKVAHMGKVAAIAFGAAGAAAAAFGHKMVGIASMAEETQAKFNTVFRGMEDETNEWALRFGKSVGRARQDVKAWMAGLQDTFVPLGFARAEAAEMSRALVKLGVDVASFNNRADDEVLRAFTSALVGNHEAVRSFGVSITETALKLEAQRQGIKKNWQDMTNYEKVMLRLKLLQDGTTDAQGDAIRTAGSYANQVKRLRANLKNLGEDIGNILLPAWTDMVTKQNKWLEENSDKIVMWFEKIWTVINTAKEIFTGFVNFLRDDWKTGTKAALDIILTEFKIFGMSVYETLKWSFDRIAGDMGVWISRALAKRKEYKQAYKRYATEYKDRLWAESGGGGKWGAQKIDEAAVHEFADTAARNWVRILEGQDFFKTEIPDRVDETLGDLGKKILTIINTEHKALAERLPPELVALWDEKMGELTAKLAAIDEKYKDKQTKNAAAAAAGAGPAGLPGGLPKATARKIGFVGVAEAWKQTALSLQPKADDAAKKQLDATKETTKMVKDNTRAVAGGTERIVQTLERLGAGVNVANAGGIFVP